MEHLIQTASDRRRLFHRGDQSPDQLNAIVYAYGRPRRQRLHWVIAGLLFCGMGALSFAASQNDPNNSPHHLQSVQQERSARMGGP